MYLQQIMPHKCLHAQGQKRKQQKVAQNMSKTNNKDTRTTPLNTESKTNRGVSRTQ